MGKRSYIILDIIRSNDYELNPTESILASCLYGLLSQNPIQFDGNSYYMADYKVVSDYCPLLPNKVDTLRRLYRNLETIGLIKIEKIGGHICFTPSQDLRDWGTSKETEEAEKNPLCGKKSVDAEKNPTEWEKNPEKAEKNPVPIYNNINNNITSSRKEIYIEPSTTCENPYVGKEDMLPAAQEKKIAETDSTLVYPFESEQGRKVWEILRRTDKWRKKTSRALQMSLHKLAEYPEEFRIKLMGDAIEGNWQGVVFDSTPENFKKWQKNKLSKQEEKEFIEDAMWYLKGNFNE